MGWGIGFMGFFELRVYASGLGVKVLRLRDSFWGFGIHVRGGFVKKSLKEFLCAMNGSGFRTCS